VEDTRIAWKQTLVTCLVARGGPLYQPKSERLENFDSQLATEIQGKALAAVALSWGAICLFLWFRFGSWTYGLAAVLCLIHDVLVTIGFVALAGALSGTVVGNLFMFSQFKLDLTAVAALLTLVGYTVNDKIVNFERIREVRGKSPELTTKMLNDSLNQTLSRTLLTGITVLLVLLTLYVAGGAGIHLFSFIILLGTVIGTYSSVYVAAPLLLIFGEGKPAHAPRPELQPAEVGA
jgi:SecD/SecF fusion protein